MIKTSVIEHELPTPEQVDGLREYASLPAEGNTGLLERCLIRAFLAVQEAADKSLLPCVLGVEDTEVENGLVRLYQDVAEIKTVRVDGKTTNDYGHVGNAVRVHGSSAIVVYSTKVYDGNLCELLPVVYEYATALFDGQTDKATLSQILSQC